MDKLIMLNVSSITGWALMGPVYYLVDAVVAEGVATRGESRLFKHFKADAA